MQEIRAFRVDKGSVVIWWLGQNGYIFKTPEGTIARMSTRTRASISAGACRS